MSRLGRSDNDAAEAEQHVLYADVTSASFRYYGRKELRGTLAWQHGMDAAGRLAGCGGAERHERQIGAHDRDPVAPQQF